MVLLLLSSVEARRSEFTFQLEDDGDIEPVFYYDKEWFVNDTIKLSSGLGYYSWSNSESDLFANFPDSKISTTIDEKSVILDLLTYTHNLSFLNLKTTLGMEYQNILKNQNGYYLSDRNDGSYVNFDNEVDINLFQPYLSFESNGDVFVEDLNFMVIAMISPSSWLNVSQNTRIKPLVDYVGNSKSTRNQDMGYNFQAELSYKITSYFKISLNASYDKLPIKYSMASIATEDKFNYDFVKREVNTEETTTKGTIKLAIKDTKLKSLGMGIGAKIGSWFGFEIEEYDEKGKDAGSIVLGAGQITKSYKDKLDSSKKISDHVNNIITIGYEKKF